MNDEGKETSMKNVKDFIGKTIKTTNRVEGKLKLVDVVITPEMADEFLKLYESGVDPREYSIKIFLNMAYGVLNNVYYQNVFDKTAGGDCTRVGRQWTKYVRKRLHKEGYGVLYSDTDSIYVIDTFNDIKRLNDIIDVIMCEIKKDLPFPQATFNLGTDDVIKYMYFFKGKNKGDKDTDIQMDELDFVNKPKGLMKKNYIYVAEDDHVVIKNLGIRKKSNSALSKKIFWEHLVPQIKEGTVKFSKTYMKNLINELLEKDISLALMRKEVGPWESYKATSPNSMPAQISKMYGAGIHFLIPNTKNMGAGKSKKLCLLKDFKERGLTIDHIDVSNVWSELDYFIKAPIKKDIFSFG